MITAPGVLTFIRLYAVPVTFDILELVNVNSPSVSTFIKATPDGFELVYPVSTSFISISSNIAFSPLTVTLSLMTTSFIVTSLPVIFSPSAKVAPFPFIVTFLLRLIGSSTITSGVKLITSIFSFFIASSKSATLSTSAMVIH